MTRAGMFKLIRRLSDLAPVLSIVFALWLTQWFSHDPQSAPTFGPEERAVRDAVDAMPYRIGRWVGRDTEIPEAAVRLLRPNAMKGRRFTDTESGITLDFMIVHCGDARDMLGHYPPVCYPNAGWILEKGRSRARDEKYERVQLHLRDNDFDAHVYEFVRMQDWGSESRIRIFNFFVLPNGELTHDIDDVGRRTNWLGASIHGVAQIQLLTSASVPLDQAIASANEVLGGMEEIFFSLGVIEDGR